MTALFAGLLAVAATGVWLFTAEASGTPPVSGYTAAPVPAWPVTAQGAAAVREDALRRAAVRLEPLATAGAHDASGTSGGPIQTAPLTCRFLRGIPTGTSAKFDCVLRRGEVIKVKYGRNPEIPAEAAATWLLRRLGYAADAVTIVPRVRCYGCPRFPFLTMRVLALAGSTDLLAPYGFERGYTDFAWVSVERRFPAPAIETPAHEGWAWWELGMSALPREEVDAFRLLAVFLAHWDNKADNQRLVCLDPPPSQPDRPCGRPLAMIDDAGATFGPPKANLARWTARPIWADRARCLVSMRGLPFDGATFPDARIGDAGRRRLARQLTALTDREVRTMFADARFPEYYSSTADARDLDAWVAAFRDRVAQIVTAGPCRT